MKDCPDGATEKLNESARSIRSLQSEPDFLLMLGQLGLSLVAWRKP